MAERVIKHGLFTWWEDATSVGAGGEEIETRVERMAFQGATVDLDDEAIAKGEAIGAFWTEEELAAHAADSEPVQESEAVDGSDDSEDELEIDVAAASAQEIADFINAASLNAQETVELAEDDDGNANVELALKIHEAEKIAQGGEGRVTVTKALEAIVSRG